MKKDGFEVKKKKSNKSDAEVINDNNTTLSQNNEMKFDKHELTYLFNNEYFDIIEKIFMNINTMEKILFSNLYTLKEEEKENKEIAIQANNVVSNNGDFPISVSNNSEDEILINSLLKQNIVNNIDNKIERNNKATLLFPENELINLKQRDSKLNFSLKYVNSVKTKVKYFALKKKNIENNISMSSHNSPDDSSNTNTSTTLDLSNPYMKIENKDNMNFDCQLTLEKNYYLINIEKQINEVEISYIIKEIIYSKNSLEKIRFYKLNYKIFDINPDVFVMITIKTEKQENYKQLFCSEIKNNIISMLKSEIKDQYNLQYKHLQSETIIINADREIIFQTMTNFDTIPGADFMIKHNKSNQNLVKGDNWSIYYLNQSVELHFTITECRTSSNLIDYWTRKSYLTKSIPEIVKFLIETKLIYLNKETTMFEFIHIFDQRIDRKSFNIFIKDKVGFMKNIKKYCEEQFKKLKNNL